jgi:hypothetical protein
VVAPARRQRWAYFNSPLDFRKSEATFRASWPSS